MSRFFRQLKRSLRQAADTEWRKRTGNRDWKYELFELRCSFMDTFFYSWFTPLTVWYESCERVIQWIPVLWKDRDWVDNYIFMILRYRIKRARYSTENHSYYANAEIYAKQMRIAELLLERLENSHEYVDQEWEEHIRLYPPRDCVKNEDGSYTLADLSKESSRDAKRLMDKEEYMWNQDFNYLMKHMRKHVRKWGN